MARGRKQELTPSTSPLHFFGSEVRRAREEAGMTQADLAAMVPCDPSTVSRIEAGALAPDRRFAGICDEAFPGLRGVFGRFYTDSRDWNSPFASPFRPFAQYEAAATTIYTFEHSLIPGLLQTEDYAHAVLSRHLSTAHGEITERVAARMTRQEVLTQDDPPMLWAVIDEGVLRRCIGDAKTMYAAVRHLAEVSALPNVVVQVLAGTAAHVGLQGSVTIAESVGVGATASIEDIADGRLAEDHLTIATLMTRFRWLQAEALSASASREMIKQIMEEQWNHDC